MARGWTSIERCRDLERDEQDQARHGAAGRTWIQA